MSSRSKSTFTITTFVWFTACVALFFAGRYSTHTERERLRAERDRERAVAEDTTARNQYLRAKISNQLGTNPIPNLKSAPLVTFVPDGDTVKIVQNQKEIWVRLEGIDCPERGQPYSEEATELTRKLCFGRIVRIESKGTDNFGRTLAHLYCDDKSVNEALLANGLAWHAAKFNDSKRYAEMESAAKKAKKNIWSDPNSIPPWDWRRDNPSR